MPFRHLGDSSLRTPSRHISAHLRMFLDTPPIIVIQFRSSCVGWVGGTQSGNNATSWSNLHDCKISSTAEIPNLNWVWQFYTWILGHVEIMQFNTFFVQPWTYFRPPKSWFGPFALKDAHVDTIIEIALMLTSTRNLQDWMIGPKRL